MNWYKVSYTTIAGDRVSWVRAETPTKATEAMRKIHPKSPTIRAELVKESRFH